MEINWMILDDVNVGVTGITTATVKIRRSSDGYIYDWSDSTFKNAAWGATTSTLTEVDATNLAGAYHKTVTTTAWADGFYQIFTDYVGTAYNRVGFGEVYLVGGIESSPSMGAITGEIAAVPSPVTATLADKLNFIFTYFKNKRIMNQTHDTLYAADGVTPIGAAPMTKTSSEVTKGDMV